MEDDGEVETSSSTTATTTKDKERERESAATEAVTDHHTEREGDIAKAQKALESVSETTAAAKTELWTGTIPPEDLQIVMDECDLTREMATQLLQENTGNVLASLKSYVRH